MISTPTSATEETSQSSAPVKSFVLTVACCWAVLGLAAWPLAQSRQIPAQIAAPVALAFLTEISFYLLPGFRRLREWIVATYRPVQVAAAMAFTALIPYLVFAIPTAHFGWRELATLAALVTAVAFCYLRPVRHPQLAILRDIAFLFLLAAAILSGIFKWIYPAPIAKLPMEVLGHLTLVRCAVVAVLLVKRTDRIVFGFIPTLREIRIGTLWAMACTAVAFPFGLMLGQVHLASHPVHPLPALLQLLGIFWFVALSEEFFFRSLLQQWLTSWTGSTTAALIIASCVYGLSHLKFPNWQFAILTTILGLFCGMAFQQARSMRASMITHTLVAAVFRLLLS